MKLDLPAATPLAHVFTGSHPLSSMVKKTEVIENGIRTVHTDKTLAIAFIQKYVFEITVYFGAEWTDIQLNEIAKDIYREFYFFNEIDFRLFMNRIRSKEIKDYVFSPRTLMNEFIKYRDERLAAAENVAIGVKAVMNSKTAELSADTDRNREVMKARQEFLRPAEVFRSKYKPTNNEDL